MGNLVLVNMVQGQRLDAMGTELQWLHRSAERKCCCVCAAHTQCIAMNCQT